MTARLARAITGPQYFAVTFGCIVGVAWIVVMGDLVSKAGAGGTAIALALGGLAILPIAACYAEMAARRPAAGGELVYAHGLGGVGPAYATGWTLALIYTATCAFEAISIGQLVALLFPAIEGPVLYRVLGQDVRLGGLAAGLVCTLGVWALNAAGTRGAARAQQWVTVARIVLMAGFLAVAVAWAEPANLEPLIPGLTAAAKATAVLSILGTAPFLYGGFNVLATATEESATSMANVGRALILGIVASGVFYILLVLAISGLVPAAQLRTLSYPAVEAFEIAMGTPVVAKIVLITAILGNLTAWNALLIAGSRVFFAMGRAHLSPAPLGRVSPRSGAPGLALALISVASIAGLLLGRGFVLPLVNIASAAFGILYVVTCLALLRERRRAEAPAPDYRVPGGGATIRIGLVAALAITAVALVQPWLANPGRVPAEAVTIAGWGVLAGLLWLLTRSRIRAIPEQERAALLGGAAR